MAMVFVILFVVLTVRDVVVVSKVPNPYAKAIGYMATGVGGVGKLMFS